MSMYGDVNDTAETWERRYVIPPGYRPVRNPDDPRSGIILVPARPRNDPIEVDAFDVPPRPNGRDAHD